MTRFPIKQMKVIGFVLFLYYMTLSVIECKEDEKYWRQLSDEYIEEALSKKHNSGVAKNVILFVADGMGPTTVTSARIYGKTEKGYLSFEKFPHIAAIKTYSANKLVPDSCSTATALFCGVKANQKTSGVDATVAQGDCDASLNLNAQVDSIINWAQQAGKSTGFVTTTRITHATPSALYAHTPDRKWECEDLMPKNATKCKDIARQLIEDNPGRNINVIMGGGRQCLQSNTEGSSNDPIDTWSCYSRDGRDLIRKWKEDKENKKVSYAFISNNEELKNLDTNREFVLGVFANGHLKMDHERDRGPKGMPSLENMTEAAIKVLQKDKNGFVLMVEGGMIDFGHHRGHARQALDETIAFDGAIQKALDMTKTSSSETLIIVTSDHAHSFIFTGYADRKQNILGVAQKSKIDGVEYTSLLYGTGGSNNYQYSIKNGGVSRRNPIEDDTTSFLYSQQASVLTDEVTHAGTDVLVYAKGPMAHLFNNVHEQTYVAHVISYAAKIGPYKNRPIISGTKSNLIVTELQIFTIISLIHLLT